MGFTIDYVDERTRTTFQGAYAAVVSVPLDRRRGGLADLKVGIWLSKADRDADPDLQNHIALLDAEIRDRPEVVDVFDGKVTAAASPDFTDYMTSAQQNAAGKNAFKNAYDYLRANDPRFAAAVDLV